MPFCLLENSKRGTSGKRAEVGTVSYAAVTIPEKIIGLGRLLHPTV